MSLNSELDQPYQRRQPSWLITAWSWLFSLTVYGILGLVALNINQIVIRARWSAANSLFDSFWRLLLAGVLILLLTSAVHELGHLLGGRLARLRFHLLVVGPFKLSREYGRLRLGLSRGSALFNGLAASIPEELDDLRRRMMLFALGGPLASLLLAGAAGLVYWFLRTPVFQPNPYAWLMESAAITAVSSLIFFLTSMKPGSYPNGMPADGSRLLMLWRNGADAQRWCALVALNSADIQQVRPRDWEERWVQQALHGADNSQEGMVARLLAYHWLLDNGRFAQANSLLDDSLAIRASRFPGIVGRITLEKAYLLASYHQDAAAARRWLQRQRRRRANHPLVCRAEAAILLAEGEKEAAGEKAAVGLATLQTLPPTGNNLAEAAWLQTIISQAKSPG